MKYEFSDITKLYRSLGPIDDIQEGEGFVEAFGTMSRKRTHKIDKF